MFVLPHQRVPTRRVPSRSFSTLHSARSARNESLCPSPYQLERSVARRQVFGTRVNDSKHRMRCCFSFDLFTRQRNTAGFNRLLSVRRINISRTRLPYLYLRVSRSFVRSFVRTKDSNQRETNVRDRFYSDSLKNSVHRFGARSMDRKKKKKNYRQTTCHDTSMSRSSVSVCRIALAPFIPPFLSSFHRVAYQPVLSVRVHECNVADQLKGTPRSLRRSRERSSSSMFLRLSFVSFFLSLSLSLSLSLFATLLR